MEIGVTTNGSDHDGITGGSGDLSWYVQASVLGSIMPTEADVEAVGTAGFIPIEQLYPARAEVSPVLDKALSLLSEAEIYTLEAEHGLAAGDNIAADNSIQKLRAVLPELFCCRSIGDGYGAVINAVQNACDNTVMTGPLNCNQIRALLRTLREVRSAPFLSMDAAIGLILHMEDSGLMVEPTTFPYIADWLDE